MSSLPEIWVTRDAYAEILAADRMEQFMTENLTSTGLMMRARLREFITEKVAPDLPQELKIVVKPWLPFPAVYIGSDAVRDAMRRLEAHYEKPADIRRLDQRIYLQIFPATDTHCGILDMSAKCPRLQLRETDMYCAVFGISFEYDDENPERWPERLPKCRAAKLAD